MRRKVEDARVTVDPELNGWVGCSHIPPCGLNQHRPITDERPRSIQDVYVSLAADL
jgi:hypothetical protein